MTRTLCVRLSSALKREPAEYARGWRVSVATLVEQVLGKGELLSAKLAYRSQPR